MPRASSANQDNFVKALIIGDGKCGKTHWAANAAAAGLNVLYLDGDVGSQTIAGLPKEIKEKIFIMSIHDQLRAGGIDHSMVDFMGEFFTSRGKLLWNDTQSRMWSRIKDGDSTPDEIWEINPIAIDHNWVVVLDSWTSLVQSAMQWAADDLGIKLAEIDDAARKEMRSLYQTTGEKLTQYLGIIRAMKCNWVVISHPNEFTKMEKPNNTLVKAAREGDMKVLWTKMIPKSSSNNHAMTMAKYFTDLAWLETDSLGNYVIDFRASNDRMSGSHINERLKADSDGSFAQLHKRLGAKTPDSNYDWQNVIQIHEGYEVAAPVSAAKQSPLGAAPAVNKGLNLSLGKR